MVTIKPEETALLVIDMQNGACHPEGTFGMSGMDITPMQELVPRVRRLVEVCQSAGIRDIWTEQNHYLNDEGRNSHRIPHHTRKRARLLCEKGTWDAETVGELKELWTPQTEVLEKQRWSAFYGTRLEPLLRILGTRLLIVCGVTTNACVDTTVRDAFQRDYDVVIVRDCVGGVNQEWHETALEVWDWYVGEVVTLDEVAEQLSVGIAASA